jgi:hypothetical protein
MRKVEDSVRSQLWWHLYTTVYALDALAMSISGQNEYYDLAGNGGDILSATLVFRPK